jgi:hypothetical protein
MATYCNKMEILQYLAETYKNDNSALSKNVEISEWKNKVTSLKTLFLISIFNFICFLI